MAAVMIVVTFNACSKSGSSTTTSGNANEQASVSASASATASEMLYDDAFDVVTQAADQNNLLGSIVVNAINPSKVLDATIGGIPSSFSTISGATITLSPADTSTFPKSMTINYGSGITSANGVTRKGEIIVSLSGKLRNAGSLIAVSFNNYSINSFEIDGTYSITPNVVAGGGVNYNIAVTNGSITSPTGVSSTYSGTETYTQVAGEGTLSVTDDTYNITGDFTLSNGGIGTITGTITTPLSKSTDCKDITSGIIAFTYNNIKGTFDFGTGACDNVATATFGSTTTTITLAK
jgi:hypothetical protein